ncbi:hypothetical protein [Legionella sainthelensi]|uniref:hypothetical protein n=1 Tax=Legionella sainthelensi TaxID=28087 RepID=UPI000E204BCC|nr:hypothetical protein [Legionella sainthelensi]
MAHISSNTTYFSSSSLPSMMQSQIEAAQAYMTRYKDTKKTLKEFQEEFKDIINSLVQYTPSVGGIPFEDFSLFDLDDLTPEEIDILSTDMAIIHRQLNSYQGGWDSGSTIFLLLKDGKKFILPRNNHIRSKLSQ